MLINKRIPLVYHFNKIKYDLVRVLLVSLVVHVLTGRSREYLPDMPLTIPTFLGTAISILLSFKLNQSYDRWWEARKVWGAIVNDSRSLVMQLLSLTKAGNEAAIKKIAYRQIGWCYALGQTLRGQNPTDNLQPFVSPPDLAALSPIANKPLALLQQHTQDIKHLRDTDQLELFSQLQLDSTLVRLCESQGKAERIKSTVFPVTYRMFLHFAIYLFVVTLSIALRDISWRFEIPLLMCISGAFFLLEKSATYLQDPFQNKPSDTAMTAIARTIEINLKQLLNETDIPEPHQPDDFYLM